MLVQLLSFALFSHNRFGRWWGIPSALLGGALIVLNVVTFPWPPNSRNLIDIGPAIGLFIIALSTRLLLLGSRMRETSATSENADKRL